MLTTTKSTLYFNRFKKIMSLCFSWSSSSEHVLA
jgi:hypothetical protein